MHKLIKYIVCGLVLLSFEACDSGDIFPEEEKAATLGISVNANIKFTNTTAFPEDYNIALASFANGSLYPSSYTFLGKPSTDSLSIMLSNIPAETEYVSLCLLQKVGNKKLFDFYKQSITGNEKANINIAQTNINLASLGRLKSQLFAQCIQCHGGVDIAGADLYLTDDKAYSNLVNVKATKSTKNRITANSLTNSFLLDVITDNAAPVSYKHTDISTLKNDDIKLLKAWINNGAQNE